MNSKESAAVLAPVLDQAHVDELVALDQGRGALFKRFADLFVSGTGARIALLVAHSRDGNLGAVAEAAHSLRGASGNVGAVRFSGSLQRIEAAARSGDTRATAALVAMLDAEYAVTRDALIAACPGES